MKTSIMKKLGYNPLTDKVYIGDVNEKTRTWKGKKEDITNNYIDILFEYCKEKSIRTIKSESGKENLFINIVNNNESIDSVIKYLESLKK